MANKYKLEIKVKVTNQETGAVEHSTKHKFKGLDNEDVSQMQGVLIGAEAKFNGVGIEGTDAKPTLPANTAGNAG